MSTPTNPRREHPSTYIVQDRSNEEELARLRVQDQMLTAGMGGVLAEQPDPAAFRRILDVGCGTGGWLIEVAKTYPDIPLLVGVDISERFITYARTQAEAAHVDDRVQFRVMDATRMLEFPNNSFDLLNQRLAASYLRTWDWTKQLHEYQRVVRPGGIIRLTEGEMLVQSTSSALIELQTLTLKAAHHAGHFFSLDEKGLTTELANMLSQHGCKNVQSHLHALEYRAGTEAAQLYYEDMRLAFRTLGPFLRKWCHIPENYDATYQQMVSEMQQPDFVATWNLLTVWGTVPQKVEKKSSRVNKHP